MYIRIGCRGGGKQSVGVFGLVPSTGAEIMKGGPL